MKNKKYISLAVLGSLALVSPIFAQASTGTSVKTEVRGEIGNMMGRGGMMNLRAGVVGTVTSISGTTLTVTSVNKMGWGMGRIDADNNGDTKPSVTPVPGTTPNPVIYTVDASKASVIKAGIASTVSGITVGDMVIVQGAVTGTNVVATAIRDGVAAKTPKPMLTPVIAGNGQPIIAGTISAISGSTLTVTNSSDITYTVDASTAKVASKGVLSTLSTVAVGDNVVIQGTINGTAVTAYSVTDQGPTPVANVNGDNKGEGRGNMFSGISQFFKHLFGF